MRAVVAVAVLWLLGGAASPECKVDCPRGHLGVCVERDGRCLCKCAKDASAGIEKLDELLRTAGASDDAIKEAARRFGELAEEPTKALSFSVKDGEVTFYISAEGS